MPPPKRNASKKDKPESSASETDFDEDEDPDQIEVPGGGKDLESAKSMKKETSKMETDDLDSSVDSKTNSDLSSLNNSDVSNNMSGDIKPNAQPSTNVMNQASSAILEQLMTKPTMNSSKVNMGNNMGGMMSSNPYMNYMYQPTMQGFPSMPNSNFSSAQFLPPGMDMAGFNNTLNAMMMNPSIQAMLNPFLLGGNGSAMFNQLLQAQSLANWGNMSSMPMKSMSQAWMMNNMNKGNMRMEEEEEGEDEELGVAETYADYMPSKLKLGKKHPDPVVETASLSSVEPTDVWYKLVLPESTIKSGALSALQLEAVTYASQQHEHLLPDGCRAGFLIGDGAGVGKGRTIAGVIFENYLKGRKKALWVSVSNDLKYDAERDLSDIGASKIEVYPLNKFKYAKITSPANGNVKEGVIFSTYSALIGESSQAGGKYKTRLKQLLQWCGEDFDGPIIFDECHRAKNLCPVGSTKPTKTGLTVLELQKQLPKARVVYASATGASEPRNMAYMTRLGMWGKGSAFLEFMDFINAVEKRGVGAMEIVAMDMKLRGMYIARQLSFHGVSFKIDDVPLTKEFIQMYDDSVKLWVEAMQKFTEAAELIDAENRMKKTMWGQFWSAHQRFFKYLCIASKVRHAVDVAREAIKCGKCVVIGLQSTGEARTLEQLERDDGELSDFVSTAKGVLQSLVEKHFPAPDRNRIHRLLGIDTKKAKLEAQNGDAEAGSSSGKRKSVRQAAVKSRKRHKESSGSDSELNSEDSDFKVSSSSSSEEPSTAGSDSDSSEFSGTDSDDVMWGSSKKTSKKKKPVKKITQQDKIDAIITGRGLKDKNNKSIRTIPPPKDAVERACSMKEELLEQIEQLGDRLPPNTLDQLIDELGGPENVAEMTGRKGRVVQTDAGIQYESRSEIDIPLETLNLTEKQRFMDGEKEVAIISEAASSGISLQSDRRAKNQRRRVHITLELPWSADRAIQQFGRTHRSNQVNAPEYLFLISDLAGERRFASIVAKRLESLGALTHGDRRATETRDLSRFNIDNKYGRQALESTMRAIMGYTAPVVPPPKDYKGNFFQDIADALVGVGLIINSESSPGVLALDKDFNNISKFLNRILGMPVELQNRLFKYFTDTLEAIVTEAKKAGRFDLGILDLGSAGENVKRVRFYTFARKHSTGVAKTQLHIVHVERGLSWTDAMAKYSELSGPKEGFYLSHQIRNGKATAILAVAYDKDKIRKSSDATSKKDMYTIYRPNTGFQLRQETLSELEKKYKKVEAADAEKPWKEQFDTSENTCSHAYWRGNCKNVTLGMDCEVGLRRRTYNILAGSVLSVWSRVENVLAAKTGHGSKLQVVRLKTTEGIKIVGTLIPNSCVEPLREALATDAEETSEETIDN